MYNGIGLTTPRGSGTNGFVQRNLSAVKRQKDRVDYRTEEDVARLEKQLNRQPNADILYHDRKRRVELKCMEMQELMEEQGYSAEEITQKVSMFRKMLMDKEGVTESSLEKDEHGRPLAKETHQLAEANQEKNQRLREAFGLNDYVDGSAFDPNRKTKEEAAKATAMATKKYSIVQSSGSEEEGDEEPKKKKKRSRDESASPDRRKKRKKSKKHRHNRSELRKHKRSKKKPKKRRDEKPKKRSHDSSSSDEDSDSQSESDSGSEKEEDQGKIAEVTPSATRGRAAARSLTPANKRHDSSSDSDTVKTRNGNEKTSTKKNGHLSPHQKKSSRDHSRSLSYSPACKQPPSSESYNYTNGRSKTSEKKQNAKARSRSRSKSPSQSRISSQTSKNSAGADGKAQRQRSPKRSRTRSRSHSRARSRKSESIEKRRARSRSCSRSRSYSRSFSRSRSRNRTPHRVTRSPSIRRRHGSPSHLDKRRITSARKRPVPYYRPSPPPSSSSSSYYSSRSRSRSGSRSRFRSLSRSPSLSFRRRRYSPNILGALA